MTPLITFSFFIFGAIIGSFLNVVVLRYGTKSISGRSYCFSCGKTLRWFELIPLFSFLIQGGRCRSCHTRISSQYPLVELATGLVFATIAWKEFFAFFSFSFLSTIYYLLSTILWSLLIALSVYDLKHKIIPDALVYTACFLSFLIFSFRFFSTNYHLLSTSYLLDLVAGPLFAAPFALLWFFSKGRAMGLGDAKLVMLFPWFLGIANGLSAVFIGFWLGALVSLCALLLKSLASLFPQHLYPNLRNKVKYVGLKTEIPLGPFLVLGLFLVYVFGEDVTGLGVMLASSG